jgi:hypothetical protein
MCELLVRVVAKTQADPRLAAQCSKPGDVIAIVDDGHQWGTDEGAPTYRVVRVPGVPANSLASLVVGQPATPEQQTMLQRRAFGLQLDGLADTMTEAGVMALRYRKPYLQDPDVLG